MLASAALSGGWPGRVLARAGYGRKVHSPLIAVDVLRNASCHCDPVLVVAQNFSDVYRAYRLVLISAFIFEVRYVCCGESQE